jgi:hypothetical protein
MDERAAKVSELLHEAAETHHRVFRITDGADDDWASWYSEWLVTLAELPGLLGGKVVRSELTWLLVRLDKEYTERRPDQRWEDWYAGELLAHSAPADPGRRLAGRGGRGEDEPFALSTSKRGARWPTP